MNFIFGIIIGSFITLFCMQPEYLGNALHWAGNKIGDREQIEVFTNDY